MWEEFYYNLKSIFEPTKEKKMFTFETREQFFI